VSPTRLLSELETVAARLGIALRVEPFGDERLGARGGLCRIRGRPLILIDASLPLADQISVLAGALSAFDVSGIYVPPLVRTRIESTAGATASTPAPSGASGSASPR
jgi:hypothetical protein